MSPPPDISQQIRHEASVLGLGDVATPSLETVERRRVQLWVVSTLVLVAASVAMTLLSLSADVSVEGPISPAVVRISLVAITLGFVAYAVEKEMHMRQLSKLLLDERILTVTLRSRIDELASLLDAGKAMNSVLDLPDVLDVILGSALDLVDGEAGSIMLLESDWLRAVCVRGNEHARDAAVLIGEGIAGRVAMTGEPILINGRADAEQFPGLEDRVNVVESAMSLPLVHRDHVLGVLNINAGLGRAFTEYDLRAFSIFAEEAASAIANAALYERERENVTSLRQLDRARSEFVSSFAPDLRSTVPILEQIAEALRTGVVDGPTATSLAARLESQARALDMTIDQLMAAVHPARPDDLTRIVPT